MLWRLRSTQRLQLPLQVTDLLKIVYQIFQAHKLVCKQLVVLIILGARAQVLIQLPFQTPLQIRWLLLPTP